MNVKAIKAIGGKEKLVKVYAVCRNWRCNT
jgi:hypothetical protein